MRWLVLVAAAGCWGTPRPTPPLSNASGALEAATTPWRMTNAGLGPLGAGSEATQAALHAALPSVTVKTTNLGGDSGIVFDVFDGAEKLFYVVPDEDDHAEGGDHRYAKTIFSIFATSARVSVEGHSWRIGTPLDKADGLVRCECWGDGEVTACVTNANLSLILRRAMRACRAARTVGDGRSPRRTPHVEARRRRVELFRTCVSARLTAKAAVRACADDV